MQKTILSTADVARLFHVTETTVKRWADDGALKCQRTPGGHRKFVIKYVIEFAERNNLEPLGVLRVPFDDERRAAEMQMAILERNFPVLVRAFLDRALSSDESSLARFFSYLYEHKIALWQLYDDIIKPAMQEIGERWQRGELGIDQEHRATYETLDALSKLQSEIRMKPSNGKVALLTCMNEELHEVGLRCTANLFESEGWQAHYLGARMPVSAIIRAIREVRPAAVCVSVTQFDQAQQFGPRLKEVAVAAHENGAMAILGGRAAQEKGYSQKYYDHVATSAKELVNLLEQSESSLDVGVPRHAGPAA